HCAHQAFVRSFERQMLEGSLYGFSTGVGENHDVITGPLAQGLGEQGCSFASGALGHERNALLHQTKIFSYQLGMIMTQQVDSESAYQIQDFNQMLSPALPHVVAFGSLVDGI